MNGELVSYWISICHRSRGYEQVLLVPTGDHGQCLTDNRLSACKECYKADELTPLPTEEAHAISYRTGISLSQLGLCGISAVANEPTTDMIMTHRQARALVARDLNSFLIKPAWVVGAFFCFLPPLLRSLRSICCVPSSPASINRSFQSD